MAKTEVKKIAVAVAVAAAQKKNLTEKESSAEYGKSVHWYRRARTYGGGPKYIKIPGGAVLYPRVELDAFFGGLIVASTSESSVREARHDA